MLNFYAMILGNQNSQVKFLTITCFVSIFPFVFLTFFTIPSADDIFYHNYGLNKTIPEFLIHHYNTWTGRYFSNLMMAINPYSLTSSVAAYPIMTFAVQLFFFGACFYFVYALVQSLTSNLNSTKSFNLNLKKNSHPNSHLNSPLNVKSLVMLMTLTWIALFFHKMPRPTDSLYWFAGTSSHTVAMSLVLIGISTYLKSFKKSTWSQINSYLFIAMLTVAICGSNETLMLQWIFVMCLAFIYEKLIFQRFNLKLLIPFITALFCFVIVFLAPGNKIRAQNLQGGHDLLLLMVKPWGLIIETSVRYLSLNLIILLFWLLPEFKNFQSQLHPFLREKKSVLLFYLLWIGFFALTFVPSVWTMGGLPPRRVLNNTYLIILFLSFFIVLLKIDQWEFLFRWKKSWDKYFPLKFQKMVFALSFVILFNNYYAWKDLIFVPTFLKSLELRESILKTKVSQDAELPPLDYFPTTFFYEDITTDSQDYRNIVFAEFYKLKSVKLTKPYAE